MSADIRRFPGEDPQGFGSDRSEGQTRPQIEMASEFAEVIHDFKLNTHVRRGRHPYNAPRIEASVTEIKFETFFHKGAPEGYSIELKSADRVRPVGTIRILSDGLVRQRGDLSLLLGEETPDTTDDSARDTELDDEFRSIIGLDIMTEDEVLSAMKHLRVGLSHWPEDVEIPNSSSSRGGPSAETAELIQRLTTAMANQQEIRVSEWAEKDARYSVRTESGLDGIPVQIALIKEKTVIDHGEALRTETTELRFRNGLPTQAAKYSSYDQKSLKSVRSNRRRKALFEAQAHFLQEKALLDRDGYPHATKEQVDTGISILSARIVDIQAERAIHEPLEPGGRTKVEFIGNGGEAIELFRKDEPQDRTDDRDDDRDQ
jgi:hypothetical protein